MKKTLSFFLASLMLASALSACSADPSVQGEDTTAASDTTAPAETTEAETTADPLADGLPDDVNYQNYKFRIGASESEPEWYAYLVRSEEKGEVLNDAIYAANRAVSERFGVVFVHSPIPGQNSGLANPVIQNAQAGANEYDIVTLHDNRSADAMLAGAFRNVHELEHIDLTKPWWPEYTVNSLTVNGKMYMIANSMSYYGLESTRCLFFNKGMMRDMGITLPYDDVRAGTWYLDDLFNMTKDIYSDLDTDGKRSLGDRYGFAVTGNVFCWLESFGIDVFGRGEDGRIVDTFGTERDVNMVQKSNAWVNGGTKGVYYAPKHGGYFTEDSALTMFGNGNVLFSFNSVGRQVQACMESKVEYGILPMPKLDAEQEDYISGCVDNPVCIPITTTDMDRTGMIVEAMSAEGYRRVQPAYTETVMKGRYATDKDSVEMLNIIFDARMLSAGYLFCRSSDVRFQMIVHTFWQQQSSDANVVSYLESNRGAVQKKIDELNTFFGYSK